MIYLALLMVIVFSATQIVYGTQTDLKTKVAQQVERIKLICGKTVYVAKPQADCHSMRNMDRLPD